MAWLRTHLILLPLFAVAASACANRPTVKVCDPCGCRCVAAPILIACGEVPRTPDKPGADPVTVTKEPPALLDEMPLDVTPSPDDVIEKTLAKKKIRGLSWEETNLDQAVSYLRTITGVNFYISPKVREEKFEDVLYTLQFDDVSARSVLDVITEPFGLRWEPREGVIWILTREETAGPRKLRYFDVKDLVGEGGPFKHDHELAEAIREEVHPTYWDAKETALEVRQGILIVRASRGIIEAVSIRLAHERRKLNPGVISAAWKKRMDATLVSFSVKEQSLSDVIKTLQLHTGLNLMIDPRIVSDVANNPIVGLELESAPLSSALAMLAAAAGEHALWITRGNIVVLTFKEFLDVR